MPDPSIVRQWVPWTYSKSPKHNPNDEPVYRDAEGRIRLQVGRMVPDRTYRVPAADRAHDLLFYKAAEDGQVWTCVERKRFFFAAGSQTLWQTMGGLSQPKKELVRNA